MPSTLLLIGSGPGIGLTTATHFTLKSPKFTKVALISRDSSRLLNDKKSLLSSLPSERKNNVDVKIWAVDITDAERYKGVLKEVEEWSKKGRGEGEGEGEAGVDCVIFNAARIKRSPVLEFEAGEVVYDFMLTNIALYTTAQWALPLLSHLSEDRKPSFLVTSSLLWKEPVPELFSLSMVKTSQRSLVDSLRRNFRDVHIALLNVGGVVSPEDEYFNPKLIAEKYWELYSQEKSAWTFDLDVLGAQ